MAVTINDIARYCGVSKSTVSRVLNGKDRVAPHVRKRVLEGVKALRYTPNSAARVLSLKKSHTIALVVQDIRNPFFSFASWYAEKYLLQAGYRMFVCNANNDVELERETLESMKYHGVDGVLNVGGTKDPTNLVNFHLRDNIPIVLVDREANGFKLPAVNVDNRTGGILATNYLLDLGHRNLVFATSDFYGTEGSRREGFIETIARRGLRLNESSLISQSEELWEEGECPELEKRIHKGDIPTAIFASNDLKACQVIRVLKRNGVSVPEQTSVIGFDDISIAELTEPRLTTVRQPLREMIEHGLELLLSIISGNQDVLEPKKFGLVLVERGSTAPSPRKSARRAANPRSQKGKEVAEN